MKPKQRTLPLLTYLVNLVCQDHYGRHFKECFYVGNDEPLTLDQIGNVVDQWLHDRIEPKAKQVISFDVSKPITV